MTATKKHALNLKIPLELITVFETYIIKQDVS